MFVILVLVELAVMATGAELLRTLAGLLVVLVVLTGWRAARAREIYLAALSAILFALVLIFAEDRLALLNRALAQSAFLASFFLLVGLLREGAVRAPAVAAVGSYLTNQPPSRRFLSVFFGGHYFAILSNLGALSLMTPIIQSGVRANLPEGAPLDEVSRVRERRQITALLRGFCWILMWAPTAVTQAVLPKLIPGIEPLRLIALGLTVLAMMTLLAWAEDWLRWRRYSARRAQLNIPRAPVAKHVPWPAVGVLAIVSGALFGLGLLFIQVLGVSIINGVLLAVVPVVAAWLMVQATSRAAFAVRGGEILGTRLPSYIREVLFIAAAGFIGTTAGALLPVTQIAGALNLAALAPWVVMAAISGLFWIAGNLGLSPITVTVFLGAVIGELVRQNIALPTDVTHLALAIAAGSAISTVGAPFSAGSVLLSKATGIDARTLTWRWNGVYVVAAFALLVLFYRVIAG